MDSKKAVIDLCGKLRTERQAQSLSTYDMAELTGLYSTHISQVERGLRGRVAVETFVKMVNALGMDVVLRKRDVESQ